MAEVHALAATRGPMVALEVWQNGQCALCGAEVPLRWLVADHCHDSGRVRGLLCMGCNALESRGPQRARDSSHGLALASYLAHPPTQMLGLHVQYHAVPSWRLDCAHYHLEERDRLHAEIAAQIARAEARRAADARGGTSRIR